MEKNNTRHHSKTPITASLAITALFVITDAGAQSADRLADTRAQYDLAIQGELYYEAADAAKTHIEELLKNPDPDKNRWGDALVQLGFAQYQTDDFAAAIENYRLAIEILSDEHGHLDASLAEPLLGLSRTQSASGELPDAVDSYNRLLHVQQVNAGPHTMAQADAVNELSTIYYYLGNRQRANALQQAYVSIFQHEFPDDYIAQLPAHFSRAQMLQRTDRLIDSQNAYRRIIANVEDADTRRSLHLLPAFYELSDLLQQNRIVDGYDGSYKARRYLRRAIHIAKKHEHSTPLHLADAYIAYGDYLMVQTADRRKAIRQYLEAWNLLDADPAYSAELEDRFGVPTVLNDIPSQSTTAMRKLMLLAQTRTDEPSGRLAAHYVVGADGRTRDVEVIEGDPANYWDSIITNHIDNFVFRPGIVDGETAEFGDRLYEIRYSAEDQELPADLRQNELSRQVNFSQ
jgi:tetratricopeptide (TPR) repeat protein